MLEGILAFMYPGVPCSLLLYEQSKVTVNWVWSFVLITKCSMVLTVKKAILERKIKRGEWYPIEIHHYFFLCTSNYYRGCIMVGRPHFYSRFWSIALHIFHLPEIRGVKRHLSPRCWCHCKNSVYTFFAFVTKKSFVIWSNICVAQDLSHYTILYCQQ